jgi:hypothetical protein
MYFDIVETTTTMHETKNLTPTTRPTQTDNKGGGEAK